MSDLISRQAAIKEIDDLPNCYNGYSDTYDKAYIIGTLEELPSVDAVEVVRCKNCKWKQGSECVMFSDVRPFQNDYCSRGERREEK